MPEVQQQQLDAEFDAATNLLLCAREQLSKRERHPPRSGISILWISVCHGTRGAGSFEEFPLRRQRSFNKGLS